MHENYIFHLINVDKLKNYQFLSTFLVPLNDPKLLQKNLKGF